MVPLGLFPVLAATVTLILIQMNTGECLGIGPIASNVYSHGLFADTQPFIHSSSRERRSEQCGQGNYLHPNGTHCCILCHKGTHVVQHCPSENRITICQPCPAGSFTNLENSSEKCRGCQYCRPSFGQITLTDCSTTQDTVCGCPSNQYRTISDSPDFFCKPCSACQNGTILKECSTSSDAVCRCHKGFFLETRKNRCLPCNSCQGEECKEECDGMVTIPSRSPPNSSVLTPIFGTMVVILTAALLFLAVRWGAKQPVSKKLISAFRIHRPKQQPSPADPQLPQHEVQVNSIPHDPNQKEVLLPAVAIPMPPDAQRLPDCILPAEGTQIPDSPAVLYAVVDNLPFNHWNEFVRRLGLTDNTIRRIQVQEWNVRDAQYQMLIHWRQQLGQRATVESISSVLNEMELSGCGEEIQEAWSRLALRGHREASECLLLWTAAASHV